MVPERQADASDSNPLLAGIITELRLNNTQGETPGNLEWRAGLESRFLTYFNRLPEEKRAIAQVMVAAVLNDVALALDGALDDCPQSMLNALAAVTRATAELPARVEAAISTETSSAR